MVTRARTLLDSRAILAVVSAVLSVVVFTSPSAVALTIPDNSVSSIKILDDSILSRDIRDGAIRGQDIADGSIGTADVAAALRPLWARIGVRDEAGTIPVVVAGRGVNRVAITEGWGGADFYIVTFNRPIMACGWTVSMNARGPGPARGWGAPSVTYYGDSGSDAYKLQVELHQSNFDTASLTGDNTFTVVVHC